jgi:D-arabinan exo alpha-(1,3)/(1,5)-arabinofuranosidase (non-reducing end)
VVNQAPAPCQAFFFQVQYLELEDQSSPLRFHAQWRREHPTRSGVPYRVLEATGSGHFAGMHLWMQKSGWWLDPARMLGRVQETGSPVSAVFPEAAGMGMLEGWESIYVDGEETPSIPGTGNEDYFNSGFYFSRGPYSAPHWGCTVRSYLTSRCAAYRFHIADAIPFQRSIVVDMDHGYTNQVQTDYSSVAYWYQVEPHATFPSLPPVAQRLPTPTAQNAMQFALLTSPAWVPATMVGLKILRKVVLGRK